MDNERKIGENEDLEKGKEEEEEKKDDSKDVKER